MDPENVGKEAIIRVTDWLRGIWEMKRNGGPVQQWVDSIPSPVKSTVNIQIDRSHSPASAPGDSSFHKNPIMTVSTPISVPNSPAITMTNVLTSSPNNRLARDRSFQSDSSRCSSVESLLEQRKADPEAILFGLGFGGSSKNTNENGTISRIPKRFLKPSKLKGIAIEEFVKRQQTSSESFDSTSMGYRGLTGPPHVVPSKIVQKITQSFLSLDNHESDLCPQSPLDLHYIYKSWERGRVSVLSPDNREFLERQRSKSPDMRNKRMIIGQKSFAFNDDGDLIEVERNNRQHPKSKIQLTLEDVTEDIPDIYQRSSRKIIKQESIDEASIFYPFESTKLQPTRELQSPTEHMGLNESQDLKKLSEKHISWSKSLDECNIEPLNDLEKECSNSCALGSPSRQRDARRFSDGIVNTNLSALKRRRFRRQAKIRDAEDNHVHESQSSERKEKPLEFRDDGCDSRKRHDCCDNDELNKICRHDSTNKACCYNDEKSPNCWKQVKKVYFDKNKKLENIVKSRTEMSEIREMLSNVMSVRMEPGF